MRLTLLALLAACAPHTPADHAPADHADDPVDTDVADTDHLIADTDTDLPVDSDPAPATCTDVPLAPGDYNIKLPYGGKSRRYLLHVPPAYDATAELPLVLNFHGYLDTPEDEVGRTHLNPTADANGFLLAYPAGLGQSWDGGACCGSSRDDHEDDVGFTRAVVADVERRACVDATRVYATGFSNGAFLVHRLACQAGDVFAAAVAVSGMMTIDPATCDTAHPVPLLHLHGTADIVVPYIGNPLLDYPSFDDSTQVWRDLHGCVADPVVTTGPKWRCETWSPCTDGATLERCTLNGWPHEWPNASSPLPANPVIWAFLSQFHRPTP